MKDKRIGKLTVIAKDNPSVSPSGKKRPRWICLCDCGTIKSVMQQNLKNGSTTSCGCYGREQRIKTNTKHGNSKRNKRSPEYTSWIGMIARCKDHPDYINKNIEVCEEWKDFNNFLKDMGTKPYAEASVDRIDNSKGYYKDNCRWASKQTQMINRDCTAKSGHKNVVLTESNKYSVRITRDYKVHTIGTFETLEKAIEERDKWLYNYNKLKH